MNKTELKANWNIVKGRLKQRWGDLTEDDLVYEVGLEEELYGRIARRVGQTKARVERFIRDIDIDTDI